MNKEEKLKDLILKRYHSIREFSISIDIPYTTMDTILKRGIDKSSVSNVIKICKALDISVDALADGIIAPAKERVAKPINDRIEVKEILSDTMDILTHSGKITLDGKPINRAGIDAIIDAMDVGVEMARKKV